MAASEKCDHEAAHDAFVNHVLERVPPSYDGDEAAEVIILQYLDDMQKVAQVIARITADYR